MQLLLLKRLLNQQHMQLQLQEQLLNSPGPNHEIIIQMIIVVPLIDKEPDLTLMDR